MKIPEDETWQELQLKFQAKAWSETKKIKKYASFRDWSEKAVKERRIVCDLLEAIEARCERHKVVKVKSVRFDPPDCIGRLLNGEFVGFEVTELVDQKTIEINRRGRRVWKEWTRRELLAKLRKIVRNKDSKIYHGGPYTSIILVIHTDEPLLRPTDFDSVLCDQAIFHCKQITDAYLLLSYNPGLKSYPYFKLKIARLV